MQMRYKQLQDMVETGINALFSMATPQTELIESMKYSLNAGGKRIRPIITLEFCRISGGDVEKALPVALAIEMLHTYTLIHDDLPCMDDDDLRRGKPTNHKVFGEATATLAGDALQAAAFNNVLSADIPDKAARRAALILAKAAGETGVCAGQVLDLGGEGKDLSEEEIYLIYSLKTATLIKAAAVMGAVAGGGEESQIEAAEIFGENLGLAFQIRDDILDEIGNEQILGKTVGTDRGSGKSTLVSLYGVERCEKIVEEKTKIALSAIKGEFDDIEFLCWMADWLTGREV